MPKSRRPSNRLFRWPSPENPEAKRLLFNTPSAAKGVRETVRRNVRTEFELLWKSLPGKRKELRRLASAFGFHFKRKGNRVVVEESNRLEATEAQWSALAQLRERAYFK